MKNGSQQARRQILWGLLIVAAGVAFLMQREDLLEVSMLWTYWPVILLGGFERRVHTQDFRGGEVTAVMGGCALDLRGASMTGEAIINVFAFWGGVTLKVPPDWTVVLKARRSWAASKRRRFAPPTTASA
jgi:hypothetical protein